MLPTLNGVHPVRVLLVEDEVLISEWVTESLMEQGFAVSAVGNAADALHLLRSAPVDVLFTDINLPGSMDGSVLAVRARELYPDLPVAYTSGRLSVLDSAQRVPGSIFVRKPYVPAQVGPLLANVARATTERPTL